MNFRKKVIITPKKEISLTRNPFAVIAHAFPGLDSIQALLDASAGVKVIGVVSMSNEGAERYPIFAILSPFFLVPQGQYQ